MLKIIKTFTAVLVVSALATSAGAIDLATISPISTPQPQPDGVVNSLGWGASLDILPGGSLTMGGAPQFVSGDVTLSGNAHMGWYGHGNFELDDGTGAPQPNTVTIMDDATFEVDRNGAAHGYVGTTGMNTQGIGGFCFGLEWNQYSTVTIDQQGGTFISANPINGVDPWGPGLVMAHDATGGSDYVNHQYNLSGGVCLVSGITNLSSAPTGPTPAAGGTGNGLAPIFNFNGGTLRASQSDSTDPGDIANGWGDFMSNLYHAYVQAGGAIIDTQGFTNKINQALESGAPGDGGLTKLGGGILTLLIQSTYTGDTDVQAGVLSVGHAYLDDASSVSIAAGAQMDLNHGDTDVIFGLTFGGVGQGPGIYNSGNSGGFLTGTGSLQVIPEPATMGLLMFGGLGVLLKRKRR